MGILYKVIHVCLTPLRRGGRERRKKRKKKTRKKKKKVRSLLKSKKEKIEDRTQTEEEEERWEKNWQGDWGGILKEGGPCGFHLSSGTKGEKRSGGGSKGTLIVKWGGLFGGV